MNRTDLQQLADLRIDEARALLQLPVPMPDAAYYLAGYAVECALKACIAKQVSQHDFPDKLLAQDCYTHNLAQLLRVARLDTIYRTHETATPGFSKNWECVSAWTEGARYERHALADAEQLFRAITDPLNGVLPWLKVHW